MAGGTSCLWIDGEPLGAPPRIDPPRLFESVLARPSVRTRASELVALSTAPSHLGPSEPTLYVFQRECATVPIARQFVVGSDAATTCHILIAVGRSAVFCAHLDGSHGQVPALLRELGAAFTPDPHRQDVDLHIAGGFDDEGGLSAELGAELLAGLHRAGGGAPRFHLRTCCVGPLNTVPATVRFGGKDVTSVAPAVRALAWDTRAGRLLVNPWFADRGPEAARRAAFSIAGTLPLARPYDAEAGRFVFGPDYRLEPMPPRHVNLLLALDDESLLAEASTSPLVEHETFAADLRAALRFLRDSRPE